MQLIRTGREAFCGVKEYEVRSYMHQPWRERGLIYATNGHIICEWPDDGGEYPERTEHMPNIEKFMSTHWRDTWWIDMPSLPDFIPCSVCDGSGKNEWFMDEDEDGREYKNRDGKWHTCWPCDGYGEEGRRVPINDTGFQIRYLRVLSALPGLRISPEGMKAMPFKFDGGRGLLMPMRER